MEFSLLTQILLGAVPAFIFIAVMTVLSIVKKKGKRKIAANVVSAALFAIIAVSSAVFLPGFLNNHEEQYTPPPAVVLSQRDCFDFFYAFARSGDLSAAENFLTDAMTSMDYTDDYTLARARLAQLNGKDHIAQLLYAKLDKTPEADPDLGRENAALDSIVAAVNYAQDAYARFISTGLLDVESADAVLRELVSLERRNSDIFTTKIVRESRLKLLCLTGDYTGITRALSMASDYKEIIIASELLIYGFVTPKDFSESFVSKQETEGYTLVVQKLKEAYEKYWSEENREEKRRIQNIIRSYEAIARNPIMGKILHSLTTYVESPGAEELSKTFMQLAKIEIFLGNDARAEHYIDRSMAEIGMSMDENFRAPMFELIGIVTERGNAERLKNVARYVNEVLENSLPIRIVPPESPVYAFPGEDNSSSIDEENMPDFIPPEITDEVPIDERIRQGVNNTIVKMRASVKIVSVDVTNFKEVEAVITLDGEITGTDEEIRQLLTVADCGINIEDFTIEKVNFAGANILLVCDTSGSMSADNAIGHLRDAVKMFVQDKSPNEHIGLVTFSSGIGIVHPIGTDSSTLISTADSLRASGGTAIFGTMSSDTVLDMFTLQSDMLNFVILMSDGQDNHKRNSSDIFEFAAKPAIEKGITIYTLGLTRAVDADYLELFSDYTGGVYHYAESPEQMQALFDSLRALAQNRYILRYTARDDATINPRDLVVTINTQSFASDTFWYTLDGSDPEIPEPGVPRSVAFEGVTIHGFNPSYIVKGTKDHNVQLLGEGFERDNNLQLLLVSNETNMAITHVLKHTYIDANTYDVAIPGNLPIGFYNLIVRINGKEGSVRDALYISCTSADERFAFGPYVFTSRRIRNNTDGSVTMLDFVTLNGWLRFNGEITIRVQDDRTAYVTDMRGSHILYSKATADGMLANFLADKNRPVSLRPLNQFTIYNDTTHNPNDDKYQTQEIRSILIGMGLIDILPTIRLYPDRVKIDMPEINNISTLSLNLPAADKILKLQTKQNVTNQTGWNNFFVFKAQLGGTFDGTTAGIRADVSFERANDDYTVMKPVTLGKQNLAVNPSAEIKIDTFAGDYDIKFMVDFNFMRTPRSRKTDGGVGLGLQVVWKSNKLDGMTFYVNKEFNTYIGKVPTTFKNFNIGVRGMAENPDNPLKWVFSGGCDIAFAKASSLIPGLPKPFGDVAVLEFEKARVEIRLSNFYIGISTDIKVFGIKCGSAEIKAGNITYSNALLGINREDVLGFMAKVNAGVDFKVANINLDIGGSAEFTLTTRWCGITIAGHLIASIDLWIVRPSINFGGALTVGMEITRDQNFQFVLAGRANGSNSNAFHLTWALGRGGGY
jgi:hypothetical protein